MNLFTKLNQCRLCKSVDLRTYLDLGRMPLVNSLVTNRDKEEHFFPLQVQYCKQCFLSQLTLVVNPAVMFSDYCYRSSISKTFREHCSDLVAACRKRLTLAKGALIVDIASNDGCLLSCFKKEGFDVLGVEPAANLAKIAITSGIPTINRFWGVEACQTLLKEKGPAKVITGTNVFAHVDDVETFVRNARDLLDDEGILLLEFPHCVDLIEKGEYDTVYHEHLSYFLLKPLIPFFERLDMVLFDCEKTPIHGGSLRIYVRKKENQKLPVSDVVRTIVSEEEKNGFYVAEKYAHFADQTSLSREKLTTLLRDIVKQGKSVVGYGASAKGNILLNFCKIGPETLHFIVDDTPEKQNRWTPGMHIPIRDASALDKGHYDYLLLLAWNFKEAIMEKTTHFRKMGGKYIIPIPEVAVI